MKVIFFTEELAEKNGWGRYSLDLINSLKSLGLEVEVICHRLAPQVKNVKQHQLLPSSLSYRSNYFLFWLTVLKGFFRLRKLKGSIIHCAVETYAPTAWCLSLLTSWPMFLAIHGSFGVKPFKYFWFGLVQKIVYQSKKVKIICGSHFTQKIILSRITKLIKSFVIPHGVNLSNLSKSRDIKNISLLPVVLGVGAVKKRKGYHLVVEALPKIVKIFPDFKYWIVGNQGDKLYVDSLKARIKELKLTDHITFFENISDQKLNNLYQQADLFVLTPTSDEYNFEGFGLVYLKANAHGLPVIGMKGSGAEEAIVHGQTGFLADINDSESVADLIIKVLKDDNLYSKMSKAGITWAKDHSWDKIAVKYLNLYTTGDADN